MKQNKFIFSFLTFIILILFPAIFVGCGKIELNSKWRDRDITIDGIDTDWRNATMYIEKVKVAVGLCNDENYMYVSITPWDRIIQAQMMMAGFTLWFDKTGGNNKTFGVRFPLGMHDMGIPIRNGGSRSNAEKRLRMFKESQKELEILGPGEEEACKMSIEAACVQGLHVKIGNSDGKLFYELKVPLSKNSQFPYAIEADTGDSISIGFETAELDLKMNKMDRKATHNGGRSNGMMQSGGRRLSSGERLSKRGNSRLALIKLALIPGIVLVSTHLWKSL